MNNKTQAKCLSLLERTEYYEDAGEWRIANSDWILMSGATLRTLVEVTTQVLGPGSKAILFQAGKASGRDFANSLLKEGFKVKELRFALETLLTRAGWGRFLVRVSDEKQGALVRIHNSVTARQTTGKEPICYFIGGYVAGVLEVQLKKRVVCIETKCLANGDHFCEFRVDFFQDNQAKTLSSSTSKPCN